jgi:hypothetical protein
MTWLIDYLEADGRKIILANNVNEAEVLLKTHLYRIVIVDLNIPAVGDAKSYLQEKGAIYDRFGGLYLAELARNMGHRGRQVVVYSVHESREIEDFSNRIGFTYITKGCQRMLKQEIDSILSYDPTERK